jgi:CRP/FNR family transcriptional regulator, anaerobic regulatory protein
MTTIAESLAEHETYERYGTGRVLFREGDEPQGVYIVHTGQVDLVFSGKNGNAKPLRVAEDGQILGLSCVVSHRRHDCSATTRTACELGFIDRDTFLAQIDHSPSVWFSVLQLLSQDVNSCYDCMRSITAAK